MGNLFEKWLKSVTVRGLAEIFKGEMSIKKCRFCFASDFCNRLGLKMEVGSCEEIFTNHWAISDEEDGYEAWKKKITPETLAKIFEGGWYVDACGYCPAGEFCAYTIAKARRSKSCAANNDSITRWAETETNESVNRIRLKDLIGVYEERRRIRLFLPSTSGEFLVYDSSNNFFRDYLDFFVEKIKISKDLSRELLLSSTARSVGSVFFLDVYVAPE